MVFLKKAQDAKNAVLPKWIDIFYKAYPLGSSGFVRASTDKFTNPIGLITQGNLAILYDAVLGEDMEIEVLTRSLAEIIQLRAVQEMSPAKAVGPLTQLKSLLKKEVLVPSIERESDSKKVHELFNEYFVVEARIDTLLLLALDMYVADREKIYTMRVEEIKRNQSQVVRWAKLREEKNSCRETEG